MFPDWKHLIKKWRNQILNVQRFLVLGNGFVMIEDLMRLYEGKKLSSGLWKSDVFVRDRQNMDAAIQYDESLYRRSVRQRKSEVSVDGGLLCTFMESMDGYVKLYDRIILYIVANL